MKRIIHNPLWLAGLIALVALAVSIPAVSFGQAGSHTTASAAKKKKKNVLRGPRGFKGDKGDKGDKGNAGPPGTPGANGAQGPAGPITGNLPTGTTLRGTFALRDTAAAAGEQLQQGISFGFSLSAPPVVHYINIGAAVPAGCGGTAAAPAAASGNLCLFESVAPINSTSRGEFDPVSGSNDVASTFGAAVRAASAAAGDYRVRGSWAVTG